MALPWVICLLQSPCCLVSFLGTVPHLTSVKAKLSVQPIMVFREIPLWLSGRFYGVGLLQPKRRKHTCEATQAQTTDSLTSSLSSWLAGRDCSPTHIAKHWVQASETQMSPLWGSLGNEKVANWCFLGRSPKAPPCCTQLLAATQPAIHLASPFQGHVQSRVEPENSSTSVHICFVNNKNDKGPKSPSRKLFLLSWIPLKSTTPDTNVGK